MTLMLTSFWKILFLSIIMFLTSYICGLVPLLINFSQKKLKQLTIFGAGILIGTALGIIIPEGIETLMLPIKDVSQNQSSLIGLSLISGFIFMLIVDFIIENIPKRNNSNFLISNGNSNFKISTTIGLVIHSAADGLALGAAASTERIDVEIVVFIAILLHKGPAAFTLTTFLVQGGLNRDSIRKHLLIFTMAAPVSAIFTFLILNSMNQYYDHFSLNRTENINPPYTPLYPAFSMNGNSTSHHLFTSSNSPSHATAMAMLFSGATFLYVAAFHILPETDFLEHSPHNKNTTVPSMMNLGNEHSLLRMDIADEKIEVENEADDLTKILLSPTKQLNVNVLKNINDDSEIGCFRKYLLFLSGLVFPIVISTITMDHSH
ncbi:zinc transporter ZIP9-like isoform X2 [Gordionus sp. m RMFG-2023]|uniref:zinc transporter ZIP9-like isoform X2 n=1 Tax=Gordionus sp. m RMFG-2023 TaxID=3053472 RepID=UPI0031FD8E4B